MTEEVYHDSDKTQLVCGWYDRKEKRFYFVPPMNKKNPHQQRRLADRLAKQVEQEGHTRYGQILTGETDSERRQRESHLRRLRRQGERHRTVPLKTGMTIILSSQGYRELPGESNERIKLFLEWIRNMNGRFGGTQDYGKEYAGFKFDPEEPGRNIRLDKDVAMEDVAERLALDFDDAWWFFGDNVWILKLSHDEAERYARENFVTR